MPRRRSRGDLHTASPGACRPAWRIPARRRDTAGWKCARLCHSAPRVLQSDANRPGGSWDAAVSAGGGLCQRFLSVPRVTAAMRSLPALCVKGQAHLLVRNVWAGYLGVRAVSGPVGDGKGIYGAAGGTVRNCALLFATRSVFSEKLKSFFQLAFVQSGDFPSFQH